MSSVLQTVTIDVVCAQVNADTHHAEQALTPECLRRCPHVVGSLKRGNSAGGVLMKHAQSGDTRSLPRRRYLSRRGGATTRICSIGIAFNAYNWTYLHIMHHEETYLPILSLIGYFICWFETLGSVGAPCHSTWTSALPSRT